MESLQSHIKEKAHVIWDWNGTLLSDIEHAVSTVNRILVEEDLSPTDVQTYKKIFGFPVIDYYARLGLDTSPEKFKALCEKFNQYFYDGLHLCELWPGALDTLTYVKQVGKTQSLLSASEQFMLNESVRKFKLQHLFDHVFGIADKMAASKVDRGHQLMEKVGIDPDHTILIGDTDHDLEVAKALGIDAILVEHGHQCPTRLHAVHHHVVKVF